VMIDLDKVCDVVWHSQVYGSVQPNWPNGQRHFISGLCNERVKRLLGIVLMFPKHEQSGDIAPSSQRSAVDGTPSEEI
jgi:hypothetical protein